VPTMLAPPQLPTPDVVDDATRREFLTGAAAALLLAACGADERTDSASPTTTEGGGAFPVTIDHKFGSTEIPEDPQRVLSLGYTDQDAILALGVTPIAVRYFTGDEADAVFPWAEDEADGADPEVLNMPFGELNYERIAALGPDLIVAVYSGITEEEYDTLTQIAPVVAQSSKFPDFGVPWDEMTLTAGRALGREARAEELVAEVKARFASAREDHPELAGKSMVLVGPPDGGQYSFFASDNRRTQVFTSLGLDVPEEFDEIAGDEFFGTISAERVELLDTDVVIWHQLGEEGRAAIESDPFVQQLDAAREGRMVFLEGTLHDASVFSSVLSLPFLLDRVVPMLAAAVDGTPATVATSS